MDLKIPEPTKTPSAPSCIIAALATARDGQHDRQLAQPGYLGDQMYGACRSRRPAGSALVAQRTQATDGGGD